MKKQTRLDKYLSEISGESRSEVKSWLKKGRVAVDGEKVKDAAYKVSDEQKITLDGTLLSHSKFHYLMLHKPAGVVSATKDNQDKTVLDLVMEQNWSDDPFGMNSYRNVFPVGRLDKDTEGLLLMTDDGELSHRLLSPKKHVPKCYFAMLDRETGEREQRAFREGLDIGDEKKTLPAEIKNASPEETQKENASGKQGFGVYITIHEGRFHQIKRMAHAVGCEVLYLKRVSMGGLFLDPDLPAGLCRPLTESELNGLTGTRETDRS